MTDFSHLDLQKNDAQFHVHIGINIYSYTLLHRGCGRHIFIPAIIISPSHSPLYKSVIHEGATQISFTKLFWVGHETISLLW